MIKLDTSLARAHFDAGNYGEALVSADLLDGAKGLLLKACAYSEEGKFDESLSMIEEIGPLVDAEPPRIKARFYGQRALLKSKFEDYDAALVDYEAGRYWAIEAGDEFCEACIRNNLARVYGRHGRRDDAINEVNAAIRIAERLGEHAFAGRFLDQKAQILFQCGEFTDAVDVARRAVDLLTKHGNETTLNEAQTTYGKALVRLGSSYLTSDSIDGYRARKEVDLTTVLDKALIHEALERTDGHVYQAATLLDVSHSYIIKIAGKKNLTRQPRRTRRKSYIAKAK